MEVNVDLLDQELELIDISDQEALDVFFSSGSEDGVLTSPLPGMETRNKTFDYKTRLHRYMSNQGRHFVLKVVLAMEDKKIKCINK